MNTTIGTKVDGTNLSILADLEAIMDSPYLAKSLIKLGVRSLTYRAKASLIKLRDNLDVEAGWTIDFDELYDLAKAGTGGIPTTFIDEAADKLRRIGAQIGDRPASRVKGQPGAGVNANDWADNIILSEELAEKIVSLYQKRGYSLDSDGDVTLLDYASYLQQEDWRKQREADDELLG